ncbi:hypothetical protein [Rubripirellula amarantea]|uniref:hypothetical protein n=1 Tax=Rubripirellula amarantea TaxID=2527999 RepID=UPI0011B53E52|nr:hypothetical protein [Rubripirellula amarantea]
MESCLSVPGDGGRSPTELHPSCSLAPEPASMQYRYIVVDLADGGSWHLYGDKDRPRDKPYSTNELGVLPELLADGWTPVRETPIGTASIGILRHHARAYCLVLLSKDDNAE